MTIIVSETEPIEREIGAIWIKLSIDSAFRYMDGAWQIWLGEE